jgi:hypothetical protein
MIGGTNLDLVPDEYLHGIFLSLLINSGYTYDEANILFTSYQSSSMIKMVNNMFSWTLKGKASSSILYIKAAMSESDHTLWQPNFVKKISLVQSNADHYQMLQSAAGTVLDFLQGI